MHCSFVHVWHSLSRSYTYNFIKTRTAGITVKRLTENSGANWFEIIYMRVTYCYSEGLYCFSNRQLGHITRWPRCRGIFYDISIAPSLGRCATNAFSVSASVRPVCSPITWHLRQWRHNRRTMHVPVLCSSWSSPSENAKYLRHRTSP